MRSIAMLVVLIGCGSAASTAPAAPADPAPPHTGDDLVCEPVNYACGCTWDCALLRPTGDVYVRLDSEGEQQFTRDDCTDRRCFEVCDGDACRPALVMPSQVCTEACPPSRAPFRCVRDGQSCRRVD